MGKLEAQFSWLTKAGSNYKSKDCALGRNAISAFGRIAQVRIRQKPMCHPDTSHNWHRFVATTGEIVQFENDFLLDPETRFGISANPGVIGFDSLTDRPCVVLLGDSGLGKSDVLHRAYEATADRTDGSAVFCDVGAYSDDVLIDHFFSSSTFNDWIESDRVLSLFIDGLDEGIMRANGWVGIIRRKLAEWSRRAEEGHFPAIPARLRIRISCRPGLWPESLLRDLRSFFNVEGRAGNLTAVSVWDLLPLRWHDVALAAVDHGMEPETFRKEIRRVGAHSLAARPLTLKLLIKSMLQDGRLPGSQVEMFRRGCLHLVEEHNETIRESATRPTVTAERRLQIAARIAAMSMFCGKPWIERTSGVVAISDTAVLKSSEIRGSAWREDIAEVELRETLGSSLFSYRDAQTFRWTHQAFAAFLAADWCDRSKLSLRDLRDLIVVNGAGHSGVPQQVMWAAAWLCEMRPQLQSTLAEASPSVLFLLDEAAIDPAQKPKFVRQIVRRNASHEQSRILLREGARFRYSNIAVDLKRYINDKTCSTDQRHRALDLAIACNTSELADDLARIALDRQEKPTLRRTAAFAVSRLGTDKARKAILPLAGTSNEDEIQDLKGWSLDANWPCHLSVLQVLELIEKRRRANYHGGYVTFLYRFAAELGPALADEDIESALQWCAAQRQADELSPLNDVVEAIMTRAFRSVHDPKICVLLAWEIASRLRMHVPGVPTRMRRQNPEMWQSAVEADSTSRLRLLECGMRLIDHADRYAILEFARHTGVSSSDGHALLHLAMRDPNTFSEPVGNLLAWIRDLDLIYEGINGGYLRPELRQFLYADFSNEAVNLDREHYIFQQRRQTEAEDRRSELLAGLDDALGQAEAGSPEHWINVWNIIWELSPKQWEGSPRIDESDAWLELDANHKARCIATAAKYVLQPGNIAFNFLAEQSYPMWAPAFYSALLLTWRTQSAILETGSDRVWSLWTIAALWFPFSQYSEDWAGLMDFLFAGRPNVAIASLNFVLREEVGGDHLTLVYQRRQFRWPDAVREILRDIVQSPNVPATAWAAVCEWALSSFPDEFEPLIARQVGRLSLTPSRNRRERAISACVVIFAVGREDPWPVVSPVLYEQPSLSREFFERIAGMPNEHSFLQRMSDVSLGEFYVWLVRQCPGAEIGSDHAFGAVGPGFSVAMLRNAAFFAMRERGNKDVFDYICRAFPEEAWIEQQRPALMEAACRRMWTATDPGSLLRLMAERAIPFHLSARGFYAIQALNCIFGVALALGFNEWVPRSLRFPSLLLVFAVVLGFSSAWFHYQKEARRRLLA